MPTYEYKCTECDERFEIEQSMSDDALTSLAGEDHDHQLKKVFSPIGIAFKGSGFYKNDAGGKQSSTTASSSPTSSSTDSTKPAESKPAESKPAASTDSASSASATPATAASKAD